MIDALKNIAARQVGRVLASDATMKVLSNPQVQSAMLRAINIRAEARDLVESRMQGVASALDLVTGEDVALLRRKIRDLEDEVTELRDELDEGAARAHVPPAPAAPPTAAAPIAVAAPVTPVPAPKAASASAPASEVSAAKAPPAKAAQKKTPAAKAATKKAPTRKTAAKKRPAQASKATPTRKPASPADASK